MFENIFGLCRVLGEEIHGDDHVPEIVLVTQCHSWKENGLLVHHLGTGHRFTFVVPQHTGGHLHEQVHKTSKPTQKPDQPEKKREIEAEQENT